VYHQEGEAGADAEVDVAAAEAVMGQHGHTREWTIKADQKQKQRWTQKYRR